MRPREVDTRSSPKGDYSECPETDGAVHIEVHPAPGAREIHHKCPCPCLQAGPPDHYSRQIDQQQKARENAVRLTPRSTEQESLMEIPYYSQPSPARRKAPRQAPKDLGGDWMYRNAARTEVSSPALENRDIQRIRPRRRRKRNQSRFWKCGPHARNHCDGVGLWATGLDTAPGIESRPAFQFLAKHENGSCQTHQDQVKGQNQTSPKMELKGQPAQPHPLRTPDERAQKTHGKSALY